MTIAPYSMVGAVTVNALWSITQNALTGIDGAVTKKENCNDGKN